MPSKTFIVRQEQIRQGNYTIPEGQICDYGCGKPAKVILLGKGRIEKFCCSPRYQQCPQERAKRGVALRVRMTGKLYPFQKIQKYPDDIAGQTFDKLKALRISHHTRWGWVWWVRCECGVEKTVRKDALVSGKITSCGCARTETMGEKLNAQMVGKRFGKLLVLKRARSKKDSKWWCRCDCGKEKKILGRSLQSGTTRSCGCQMVKNQLPPGEAIKHILLNAYKRNAIKRGLPWEITDAHFLALTQGACYYCGEVPSKSMKVKNCKGNYVCNGIDRFNNALGYTPNNSVPCCTSCNSMKMALDPTEFWERIKKVLARHPNGILHPTEKLPIS